MTNTPQDTVRDWLVAATAWIPSETVAGFVFGAALIASDHLFNLTKGINQ